MLRKIKVTLYDGSRKPVWAWCVGNLAIHQAMADMAGNQNKKSWTITHIPSGLAASRDCLRVEVPKVFEETQYKVWRGLRVFDMPACELINLAPTIGYDLGISSAISERWRREMQPIAVKALGCE
jgi:hypothetical protein